MRNDAHVIRNGKFFVRFRNHKRGTDPLSAANGTRSLNETNRAAFHLSSLLRFSDPLISPAKRFRGEKHAGRRYRSVLLSELSHKAPVPLRGESVLKAIEEPCSFLRDLMGCRGNGPKDEQDRRLQSIRFSRTRFKGTRKTLYSLLSRRRFYEFQLLWIIRPKDPANLLTR